MNARFLAMAATMGSDLSVAGVRAATEIVRRVSIEAEGHAERLSGSQQALSHDRGPPERGWRWAFRGIALAAPQGAIGEPIHHVTPLRSMTPALRCPYGLS